MPDQPKEKRFKDVKPLKNRALRKSDDNDD